MRKSSTPSRSSFLRTRPWTLSPSPGLRPIGSAKVRGLGDVHRAGERDRSHVLRAQVPVLVRASEVLRGQVAGTIQSSPRPLQVVVGTGVPAGDVGGDNGSPAVPAAGGQDDEQRGE